MGSKKKVDNKNFRITWRWKIYNRTFILYKPSIQQRNTWNCAYETNSEPPVKENLRLTECRFFYCIKLNILACFLFTSNHKCNFDVNLKKKSDQKVTKVFRKPNLINKQKNVQCNACASQHQTSWCPSRLKWTKQAQNLCFPQHFPNFFMLLDYKMVWNTRGWDKNINKSIKTSNQTEQANRTHLYKSISQQKWERKHLPIETCSLLR